MATNQQIYELLVKNTQAIQALGQLQEKAKQTSDTFGKLKGALVGLVAASTIKSAYDTANALVDLANASNISVAAILGFKKAIKEAGGDTADIEGGIGRFAQALESAASGSKDMQDKFAKLGVTLQDLRTLSEQEILQKIVSGLGEGETSAIKLAAGMDIFGKSFRSVKWQEAAAGLAGTTAASQGAAASYIAAAEAQQRFNSSMGKLQTELIKALTPISELAAKILEASDAIGYFIRMAVQIGLVIASFTALGKIISWGRTLLVGLAEGWGFVTTAASAVVNVFRNFGSVMKNMEMLGGPLTGTFKVMRGYLGELGPWALKSIPGLGALIGTLLVFGNAIWDGVKALGQFMGIIDKDTASTDTNTQSKDKQGQKIREVTDALSKEKDALNNLLDAYNRSNEEANNKIKADTAMINMGEEQKTAYEKQLEAYNRYITEYSKLKDQYDEKVKSGSPSDRGMATNIAETMNKLTEAYKANTPSLQENAKAFVSATQAKQLDLFRTKEMIDSQNKLQSIQDDIAKSTMSEIERKYYDIDAAAKASAKSAIEAEEARRNARMPIEEQKAYYDSALSNTAELKKKTEEGYVISRKWSTGWNNAFQQYADDATNAAQEAKRVFDIATQGMEDALMNFIKTGKFQWKDFVQLMVDELLRSQIRQLIANLGTGMQSASSGIAGGIGKLLGFASGGIIPTNGPVIVGERGPELLMGAAGMNVVPNNQLGGGNNIVYNISAVDAMSFKAMLAKDPTFLYAVTEQGRRSLPGGR